MVLPERVVTVVRVLPLEFVVRVMLPVEVLVRLEMLVLPLLPVRIVVRVAIVVPLFLARMGKTMVRRGLPANNGVSSDWVLHRWRGHFQGDRRPAERRV